MMKTDTQDSHKVDRTSVVMRGDPKIFWYMLVEMYGEQSTDRGRLAVAVAMATLLLQDKNVGEYTRQKHTTEIRAMDASEPIALLDGDRYYIFTETEDSWIVDIDDFNKGIEEARESVAYKNLCRTWEIIAIVAKESGVFGFETEVPGAGLIIAEPKR